MVDLGAFTLRKDVETRGRFLAVVRHRFRFDRGFERAEAAVAILRFRARFAVFEREEDVVERAGAALEQIALSRREARGKVVESEGIVVPTRAEVGVPSAGDAKARGSRASERKDFIETDLFGTRSASSDRQRAAGKEELLQQATCRCHTGTGEPRRPGTWREFLGNFPGSGGGPPGRRLTLEPDGDRALTARV